MICINTAAMETDKQQESLGGNIAEVSPLLSICIPCSLSVPPAPAGLFMLIMRFSCNPVQSHNVQVETLANSLAESFPSRDLIPTSASRGGWRGRTLTRLHRLMQIRLLRLACCV